jgi:hypothetical protein
MFPVSIKTKCFRYGPKPFLRRFVNFIIIIIEEFPIRRDFISADSLVVSDTLIELLNLNRYYTRWPFRTRIINIDRLPLNLSTHSKFPAAS